MSEIYGSMLATRLTGFVTPSSTNDDQFPKW